MAKVILQHEIKYEFKIDDFIDEFQQEFLGWLDESEGYVPTQFDKKDFITDEIHNLGKDDIALMTDLFTEIDDDFTMEVRF